MESLWKDIDDYFAHNLAPGDDALAHALDASAAAGLPPIAVTPTQGKLLQLLVQLRGAERVLEIGTLGGYSTIWIARALPPTGLVVTLEIDEHHAAIARENLEYAELADRAQVIVAPAAESLAVLQRSEVPPFDLVFIDADKASSDAYVEAALALSHAGTVIVVDNVVRDGRVADATSEDADIQGIRRMIERLSHTDRLSATAIQTVGSKGYDGFVLALVTPQGLTAPAQPGRRPASRRE